MWRGKNPPSPAWTPSDAKAVQDAFPGSVLVVRPEEPVEVARPLWEDEYREVQVRRSAGRPLLIVTRFR